MPGGSDRPEQFRLHILVCTNDKDDLRCGKRGGEEIFGVLKKGVLTRNLPVRVSRSSCVSAHDHGPIVMVYPDGVWYGGVTPADADDILEAHLSGRVVERLLYGRLGK